MTLWIFIIWNDEMIVYFFHLKREETRTCLALIRGKRRLIYKTPRSFCSRVSLNILTNNLISYLRRSPTFISYEQIFFILRYFFVFSILDICTNFLLKITISRVFQKKNYWIRHWGMNNRHNFLSIFRLHLPIPNFYWNW